jgi:hypothetical protein
LPGQPLPYPLVACAQRVDRTAATLRDVFFGTSLSHDADWRTGSRPDRQLIQGQFELG